MEKISKTENVQSYVRDANTWKIRVINAYAVNFSSQKMLYMFNVPNVRVYNRIAIIARNTNILIQILAHIDRLSYTKC